MSAQRNDEPNPLDSTGLCLLSLDGGGVRGLSTLYILKSIMNRLNYVRKTVSLPRVKPCEVFDLIGGTSTGGLIAIMLGRLEMDVDECIIAYTKLAEAVFSQKKSGLPFGLNRKTKAQFDSSRLENAVRETIKGSGISETDLFNDGNERWCRTFVCTVDQNTNSIVRLRSYALPDESNIPASICQAALATSAATTFFEPVHIGNRKFADGGLGANNPVDEVEGEAANIWCSESGDMKPLVKCFLSIGTGNPGIKAFQESLVEFLGQTVVSIATETEETQKRFIAKWRKHYGENRYFRFNVDQGLQSIGLDEYKQQGAIESATERYLINQAQKNRVRDCIKNLELKRSVYIMDFPPGESFAIPKIKWVVPFERNNCFSGRGSELIQLEKLLFSESGPKKIAVFGLGGVGKTSLTIELVYRIREHHEDCSIFWIPATNFESLQQAYFNICKQLYLPGWDNKNEDPKRLLQSFLSQASAGQWLLVFDNADDISMWTGSQGSDQVSRRLMDYLPSSQDGRIMFTSRDKKTAYGLVQRSQHIVEVPELSEAVAIDLLQKYLPKRDLGKHKDDAKSLLEQLTYLPLAIVQAAAYVNKNLISLAEYLLLLADQEEEMIDLLSENFEDDSRYRDVKNPVATTWLISFEQIRLRDPLAADYLSFMACVDSKDVPQSLLPPGPSRVKEVDAIGTLQAYSFIQKRAEGLALDVHRLVHLATRNWLRKEESLVQWTEKAVGRLADVIPDHKNQNRSIWKKYLTHARYALDSRLIDQDGRRRIDLAWKVGNCLDSDGRWKEAEALLVQVTNFRKKVLGEEHPDTLTSMNNLARLFQSQGKYEAAEPLYQETLRLRKKVLGEEHPDTLVSINNLARLFDSQGKYEAAEPLYQETLRLRKKVLGEEHPDTLVSMNNLARLFQSQGKYEAAESLYKEMLQL
ncbi:FabD/lysophospholipase-like protein, partial [Cadophora sp. DSE1049]